MANLKPLIKLRKFQVEEKQKILAALLREVEKFESAKRALLVQIKEERRIAEDSNDYETQAQYRMYAQNARLKIQGYDSEIRKYNQFITKAQEDMREAFSEQKKIEIIQEQREVEERLGENRKDGVRMDEVGMTGFIRKEE